MSDDLTEEETAALAEMKDAGPIEEPEVQDEPVEEEPKAEPEAKAEPKDEPKADKPPEGYVPHGAMHQERTRRQDAEKALAEMRERLEALEKPKADPAVPDPVLDPEGFTAYQRSVQKAQDDRWEAFNAERQAADTQRQRLSQAASLEAEFMSKTPEYPEAVKFLDGHRRQELAELGYANEQIAEIIRRDVNAIFDNATAQGRNPAEMLFKQAQMRGWAAPAKAADEGAKMQALQAAQENNTTLSTAGGEANGGGFTIKQLANMSEDELKGLYGKDGKLPKAVQRALGA